MDHARSEAPLDTEEIRGWQARAVGHQGDRPVEIGGEAEGETLTRGPRADDAGGVQDERELHRFRRRRVRVLPPRARWSRSCRRCCGSPRGSRRGPGAPPRAGHGRTRRSTRFIRSRTGTGERAACCSRGSTCGAGSRPRSSMKKHAGSTSRRCARRTGQDRSASRTGARERGDHVEALPHGGDGERRLGRRPARAADRRPRKRWTRREACWSRRPRRGWVSTGGTEATRAWSRRSPQAFRTSLRYGRSSRAGRGPPGEAKTLWREVRRRRSALRREDRSSTGGRTTC